MSKQNIIVAICFTVLAQETDGVASEECPVHVSVFQSPWWCPDLGGGIKSIVVFWHSIHVFCSRVWRLLIYFVLRERNTEQCLRGAYCLHHQCRANKLFWNIGHYLPYYTVEHPRNIQFLMQHCENLPSLFIWIT